MFAVLATPLTRYVMGMMRFVDRVQRRAHVVGADNSRPSWRPSPRPSLLTMGLRL
jgi:hypothetical protein